MEPFLDAGGFGRKSRGPQSFLNNPITTKRITAPMTALMIAAMTPPTRTNPTNGESASRRTGTDDDVIVTAFHVASLFLNGPV